MTLISTLRTAVRSRSLWLATLAFGVNGWTLYFTLLRVRAPDVHVDLPSGRLRVGEAKTDAGVRWVDLVPALRRSSPSIEPTQ